MGKSLVFHTLGHKPKLNNLKGTYTAIPGEPGEVIDVR